MAFLEWRKFNFFELNKGVDDGKLAQEFTSNNISLATSGNHYLVFGDNAGQIHMVSRSWHVSTFRAYELNLVLAQQLRNSSLLITVGEDEPGVSSLIKVWDTGRIGKNGVPFCTRITRAISNRNLQASTLRVHDNLQIMAVGFEDGTLLLFRGDVTRERGSRQKVLREASSAITGLAFKSSANSILLFVSTENSIYIYNITHKDKEVMSLLDNSGCSKNCSILAESLQESHFMVARNDAIYCYNSDGRGPCYAVDGEKVMLQWFRSYLIIVSKSTKLIATTPTSSETTENGHLITVLDIQNKFIVFSAVLDEIKAVLNEWGGFYIIDQQNNIYHLNEKDLQSKLSLLFKKNLYDIAIRIAKSQQYDSDGLIDIFRQYGDHLYAKGDHQGAIDQYVKTIGKLEPSYVIRKFMDSKHIDKLTLYLQALHKQGHATVDHTTLLLNCFTKLNKTDSLKEFVLQKDGELNFDIEIAIKVCRQSSPDEALLIAKKNEKHDWYIKLLLEDHKKYFEIIDYILGLDFDNAEVYMKKYGAILLQHAPYEATQLLKKLCTNFANTVEPQRADPEDFIHLFLNNSSRLVEFLDYLIKQECTLSAPVYDTLLEHYLHVWKEAQEDGLEKASSAQKTLKLLQNPDIRYDKHQALVVCHMNGFSDGILYLYEEQKLYQQILRYHMSRGDAVAALTCCKRFGHQEPTLWVQALWSCIRSGDDSFKDFLPEILQVIAKERLLSPQIIIEALGTGSAKISLEDIKPYLFNEFNKEREIINNDRELTTKYRKDTDKLKATLETLKNNPITFHGSRCAACNHTLELPSLHFLCQHSYHQHCFTSYSENESECLACQPENKKLLELLKARENNKDLNETFHSQLEKVTDGFSLAAEYFGRGVFNTIKVITDKPVINSEKEQLVVKKTPVEVSNKQVAPTYGLGAEARLRQVENKRSTPSIIPVSEGRIRLQEQRISSSLEANITLPKSVDSGKSGPQKMATNSFKDYDESKNPFSDDGNPFGEDEDDDYDKNLNPFYT